MAYSARLTMAPVMAGTATTVARAAAGSAALHKYINAPPQLAPKAEKHEPITASRAPRVRPMKVRITSGTMKNSVPSAKPQTKATMFQARRCMSAPALGAVGAVGVHIEVHDLDAALRRAVALACAPRAVMQ